MTDAVTKGEMHGCIVCGRLYNLYVVYDANGNYIGSKVMSAGGHEVKGAGRPLVACDTHSEAEVARAVERVYGQQNKDIED
jgi:hypothetical protein